MARIECQNVEQKMKDLTGHYKMRTDPKENPYTTDKLNDDQFNFISGINYALSLLTDEFIDNLDDYITDEESPILDSIKKSFATKTIEYFAEFGYYDLVQLITSFIDMDTEGWKKIK